METKFSERIKELRQHYNLTVQEFAKGSLVSSPAIHYYEAGKVTKPQKTVLVKIAKAYNSTVQWLLTGEGEMLRNGEKAAYPEEDYTSPVSKEEAYEEMRNKNLFLETEVERLWQMIGYFTNAGSAESKIRNLEFAKPQLAREPKLW